tara:strand:- start:67 stop:699 length:633 start_codon:yes stop_codon:yes gene_type:complete
MALSTISSNLIADSSITTAKIADDAVTNAKIGAGAVTNTEVNASASIDRSKFATPVCVYASSDIVNGGFAAGAWEGVEFNLEVIDTNNAFNIQEGTDANNAGVFTCPVAGRYFIACGLKMETSTTQNFAQGVIRLVLNTTGNASNGGTQIKGTSQGFAGFANSTVTSVASSTTTIIDLSVGNKVWLQANANWWGGQWRAADTYFSLMQVG